MSFCNATVSPAQGKALTRALCFPHCSSPWVTPALQCEGEESKVKQEGCEPGSRLMVSESSMAPCKGAMLLPSTTIAFIAPDVNPRWQGS